MCCWHGFDSPSLRAVAEAAHPEALSLLIRCHLPTSLIKQLGLSVPTLGVRKLQGVITSELSELRA